MEQFLNTMISGFAEAMPFFLVGCGLSLTFGVMDILNFAHGVFFMIGAFLLHTLLGGAAVNLGIFVLACVAAGAITALIGVASERLVLRTTYKRSPLTGVLATYGLFLLLQGIAMAAWGLSPLSQLPSNQTAGTLSLGNIRIAQTDILYACIGLAIGVALYLLIRRTSLGIAIRAVAQDREMAGALGVSTEIISVIAFFIGTFLAGLAGAVLAPQVSIDSTLGTSWVLYAFIVVVVGGLGSIPGSFVAAIILGVADSLCVSYAPSIQPYILYIAVVVLLLVRPQGIMGAIRRAEA